MKERRKNTTYLHWFLPGAVCWSSTVWRIFSQKSIVYLKTNPTKFVYFQTETHNTQSSRLTEKVSQKPPTTKFDETPFQFFAQKTNTFCINFRDFLPEESKIFPFFVNFSQSLFHPRNELAPTTKTYLNHSQVMAQPSHHCPLYQVPRDDWTGISMFRATNLFIISLTHLRRKR